MDIGEFPLAWRWTKGGQSTLPKEILDALRPLELEQAMQFALAAPKNFAPGATRYDPIFSDLTAKAWLKSLSIVEQRVTISWATDTALSVPWWIFCEYWNDFCYPSSDDADIFLASGRRFLRWNHFEVFEHDPCAC